ncbi:hypothetical protein DUNSADRAFT_497 [Dunaliella salina]|uniref:Encoded protein n=1 Tax=Dunaliella salina TaxID=3046 RepID=A0ABQ7FYU4_DUNSA|nr:hypothetical protein DUNSADRAFT_497 [Dunaliella salina]|eukprot:KAF5827519.1 hypothetical protein DUNSADRAFT_497 [Dunaliella salina]
MQSETVLSALRLVNGKRPHRGQELIKCKCSSGSTQRLEASTLLVLALRGGRQQELPLFAPLFAWGGLGWGWGRLAGHCSAERGASTPHSRTWWCCIALGLRLRRGPRSSGGDGACWTPGTHARETRSHGWEA